MDSVIVLLQLVIIYVVLVWGILPIIVPNLGIRRRVYRKLSQEWRTVMDKVDTAARTDKDVLVALYDEVTARYQGGRLETITQWWKVFQDPCRQQPGFMHCTGMNHLLRTLLLSSGRFREDDIRTVNVPLNFFVHQYLKVRVDGVWYDVDSWAKHAGIPFGQRMAWFG